MAFTHLHVHTKYSLLDGSSKIDELVKRAAELNFDSIAITDHGVMYGVIEFYKAAKEAGIKPILGCEVYVAPGSRLDRDASEKNADKYYHLVLLAENNTGYQNLIKIVSKGFIDGFYYKPRVDIEVLTEYHEGIIALSACLAGEIPRLLRRNLYEEACEAAKKYENIFGKGNFFLELQDHGIAEQKMVNQQLLKMSGELGIDLVATNDAHYINAEDAQPHDVLLCIQTGKKVSDEDRMRYEGGQYYIKSEEEMLSLFPYAKEAIENTHKISERCNVEIEFGVTKLPHFEVPKGYDSWTYLKFLCESGLKERYGETGLDMEALSKRLEYELSVIHKMGYVDYFLIVWDFINYAKSRKIAVGPGRGSAAGSIVAYCLRITDIDPIRYNLLFERFLNPERVSMPDIDVDFCYERRQEVIEYVRSKYGDDCVVQIVTFGTLAARGVIKDVGRVMDFPYSRTDQLAKMVPTDIGMTLDKALMANQEFKGEYENNRDVHELIEICRKLEGLPKNTSMHAAGVVIGSKPIDEFVPLSSTGDGPLVTQFTMTTIEELGLLKMDFLGLRTLTVIQNAERLISRKLNKEFSINDIDYNDQRVLDLIGSGKTEGVFQLESPGMKSFMRDLKPQSLEDLIAGISLYRPGPMDFIPQYIKGKNNPEAVTYKCPQLEPILKPTYGCIVYQEQVMQIVRDLAGYSMGRSDLVRRAMSKKKAHVMEVERNNFIYGNEKEGVNGCVKNGISEKIAGEIYDTMMDFAKYAFNKSHAACYAYVAFQTAFLKEYYPKEFMASLMTSVLDDTGKVSGYIFNCRKMGIKILPPDINEGDGDFSITDDSIRYGLKAIKSLGRPVIDAIIAERNGNGRYKSLEDLIKRLPGRELNKRSIESLIKAGALDCFETSRHQMMLMYSEIIDSETSHRKEAVTGQLSLFDMMEEQVSQVSAPNVDEYPKDDLLAMEKEVLGVYLSGHPLEDYMDLIAKNADTSANSFTIDEETQRPQVTDKQEVIVAGIIRNLKLKVTKNGKNMAIMELEDLTGSVETVVFPKPFAAYREYLSEDRRIFVVGTVDARDDENAKLLCDRVIPFESLPKECWIKFSDIETYGNKESELMAIISESGGNDIIKIYCEKERAIKTLSVKINATDDIILAALYEKYGEENVKIVEKVIEKR